MKTVLKGKKNVRTVIIVLAVLVVCCGAFLGVRSLGAFTLRDKGAAASFSTARVRRGSLAVTVTATGTLAAKARQDCIVSAGGKVVSVAVLPGQPMKAGEVLMVLSNDSLSGELAQARLSLRLAQMDLDALTTPGARNTTKADVAAAEAAVLQARLEADQARENVENLRVQAPFAGRVSGLTVIPGDRVAAGTALCTVTTPESLKAELSVDEDNVKLVSIGQALTLTVSPLIRDLKGHVTAISAQGATSQSQTSGGQTSGSQTVYEVTVKLDDSAPKVRGGMSVTTTVPTNRSWPEEVTLSGTLAYERSQTIVTATGGIVASVDAVEEQDVTAGQVLLTLESNQAQAALASAEADLAGAEQRLAQLTGGPAPYPETQIEKAEIQVEQAELKVAALERQWDELTVTPTMDGTVTSVAYAVGDQVPAGATVATVADLSEVEAVVSVDELQVAQLAPGQTATVIIDALPGETFAGTVEILALEGSVSDGVTSYEARVLFDGNERVRVGMSLSVSVQVAKRDNVILVPVEAVYGAGKKASVQVVVDGKSQVRPVTAGLSNDTYTEIVEGLSEGEMVVTGSLSADSGNSFMPGMPGTGGRVPGAGGDGPGPDRGNPPGGGGGD